MTAADALAAFHPSRAVALAAAVRATLMAARYVLSAAVTSRRNWSRMFRLAWVRFTFATVNNAETTRHSVRVCCRFAAYVARADSYFSRDWL